VVRSSEFEMKYHANSQSGTCAPSRTICRTGVLANGPPLGRSLTCPQAYNGHSLAASLNVGPTLKIPSVGEEGVWTIVWTAGKQQQLRRSRQQPEHPYPLRRRSTSPGAAGIEFRMKLGAVRHNDVANLLVADHQAVFLLGQVQRHQQA
jgi:hypothetical protein